MMCFDRSILAFWIIGAVERKKFRWWKEVVIKTKEKQDVFICLRLRETLIIVRRHMREVSIAHWFRRYRLSDCAISKFAAGYEQNNRRLSQLHLKSDWCCISKAMTGVTALEMYFENFINKFPDYQWQRGWHQHRWLLCSAGGQTLWVKQIQLILKSKVLNPKDGFLYGKVRKYLKNGGGVV